MDPEVLRHKLMDRMDALLARPLLIWGEDRRLLAAVRGYVATMPPSELEKLATHFLRREEPKMSEEQNVNPGDDWEDDDVTAWYGAAQGRAYLHDCPDCIPLPIEFPVSCVGHLAAALRGDVPDLHCALHCGYTVLGWVLGRFSPHEAPAALGAIAPSREEVIAILEKCCEEPEGDFGAVNWWAVALVVIDVIRELLARREV